MKRIAFYGFILFQIILILFLTYQFDRGLEHGETMKLKTVIPDYAMEDDYYHEDIEGTMYVDFNINHIAADKWETVSEIDYNQRVYVLLEESEAGIFEVVAGAEHELTPNENQLMLSGYYSYYDEELKVYYVRYGFEEIKNVEAYGSIRQTDELLVTVLIGKWGQRQVIDVEKID